VRDEQGTPVRAEVQVPEVGLTVRADERGRFRIDLAPGDYSIVIQAPGFVVQRKKVRARAGEQNIYNVDLHGER